MKKNLIFAGMLFVTGISQLSAQEKEEKLIPEVTIAAKAKQQLHKTGKNVQLLTSKDLEKFKGQNAAEILNQVSGYQITGNFNNGPEPKSLKIRGGKLANVLILVDGIPLKDVTGNDYTATDLRLFASENIESIEILNGASSVLYGSNATVSVINIKTKKSSQQVLEGRIGARIGSFGTFGQNLSAQGKINQWNYQFSGSNEKSDGISAALGENFDKDGFEKQNANATVGYSTQNFNVNVNAGYQHHYYDFDNGAFEDGKYKGNDTQKFSGLNAQYSYEKGNITFNSRISANERIVRNLNNNTYQDQYSYQGQNIFAELYNQTQFSEHINLVAGIQYETQNLGSKSLPWGGTSMQNVLTLGETEISNFDVFANANLAYQIFHLDLGARLNNHSKYDNHFVYSVNPFILTDLDDNFLKIGYSYATAFIAPTLYQSYGSLPYVLPNFDLKPETNASHELDFSFGKKDRTFVVNASVFSRKEKDVFVYNWDNRKFLNVESNKVKGVELGVQYHFNEKVNVGGNFSFAEKDNPATRLRSPKQRANAFLEILPIKNNRINISYQYTSKRNDAYYDSSSFSTKNVELEAFHLFNLNINQKITKSLDTYLNVGNVLNTSYTDVIGYTTKPRNITLGVEYKF
jgi:vitamin B12 transporter